jgi:hypothetical protein
MELNEIVALLETQFPGVRKDGLNQLARVIAMQVNTKEEATGIVGKLTAEAVAKFVADWRKDADAEIDKANKTREDNLRKKYDFVEKKPEEGGTPPAPAGTLDAATVQAMITNAVKEATKGLQSEVMSLQSAAANRRETLVKELADVPEAYKAKVLKDFDRVAKLGGFADENAFNEYLTETKNDVAAFGQELADRGLSLHEKPVLGSPNKDGVSAGVESYIQAKAAEAANKGLGGKEV